MYWNIWKRKSKKNLQSYKRLNDIRIFLHFLNSKIMDNKLSAWILAGILILENQKNGSDAMLKGVTQWISNGKFVFK